MATNFGPKVNGYNLIEILSLKYNETKPLCVGVRERNHLREKRQFNLQRG